MSTQNDPFDEILDLEEKFYKEGYDLGSADGKVAGLNEGRLFGLEKGFEKYVAMGEMHGRAEVWTQRMQQRVEKETSALQAKKPGGADLTKPGNVIDREAIATPVDKTKSPLQNPRLASHVRVLRDLTDPETLSTVNREDDVADFDERFKKAEGKIKIIEKLVGEHSLSDFDEAFKKASQEGDGGIEDASTLHARH